MARTDTAREVCSSAPSNWIRLFASAYARCWPYAITQRDQYSYGAVRTFEENVDRLPIHELRRCGRTHDFDADAQALSAGYGSLFYTVANCNEAIVEQAIAIAVRLRADAIAYSAEGTCTLHRRRAPDGGP